MSRAGPSASELGPRWDPRPATSVLHALRQPLSVRAYVRCTRYCFDVRYSHNRRTRNRRFFFFLRNVSLRSILKHERFRLRIYKIKIKCKTLYFKSAAYKPFGHRSDGIRRCDNPVTTAWSLSASYRIASVMDRCQKKKKKEFNFSILFLKRR